MDRAGLGATVLQAQQMHPLLYTPSKRARCVDVWWAHEALDIQSAVLF